MRGFSRAAARITLFLLLFSHTWSSLTAQTAPVPRFSSPSPSNPSSHLPTSCQVQARTSTHTKALLESLGEHPSAEAYGGLGAWYGRQGNFPCAVAAFKLALTLDTSATEARYDLALALIQDRKPSLATEQLHEVLRADPKSFKAHDALGLALQDSGRAEEAANEFKSAIEINPAFARSYYDFARLLALRKNYSAAIYYLKSGLAASPSEDLASEMKLALAFACAQQGAYSEATPILEELVTAHENLPDLHFDLATAYAHSGKYLQAVKEYKEVLRLDPARLEAELLLAKALLNQSAVEDSLPYLHDYVHRKPADVEGLEILGDALKESAHLSEAEQVLRRTVRANPSSYKAHYDLGVVLSRSGHDEEAIRELQTAIKLNPDGAEARYQLARQFAKSKDEAAAKEQFAAFEQLKHEEELKTKVNFLSNQASDFLTAGRTTEALEAYQQALLLAPKDAKLHYNLAMAFSRVPDSASEERELSKTIALDPKLTEARNQLGSLFLAAGKLADAERQFRAAVASEPQSAELLNNLGTALGRQGHNAEAEALFRKAIMADPQGVQGLINLGLTLAAEGSFPEAERQFQTALRLDPNSAGALTGLGMLQAKAGHPTESVQTFRKLVALDPKSAEAHVNLGIALGDSNDLDGALAEFSEATRLAPNSALAQYNKGRVLYALHRTGDSRQALDTAVHLSPNYVDAMMLLGSIEHFSPYATELFQRVVKLEPGNSQAHFYLGRNLLQEGEKDEAITQWKKAVELNPDNLSALSSLVRTLTQAKSPEAQDYANRLEALEKKKQLTDRVKELNNFALRSADEKNWPQAVGQLQEAITLCHECAQIGTLRKNIGLIYAQAGDVEHAKEQLQLALKLLPASPDTAAITQMLQRLNSQAPSLNH